jgi:hypothetical protein
VTLRGEANDADIDLGTARNIANLEGLGRYITKKKTL